ncbi:divalent-cation tolerance protein CutA [Roseicyclus amphidinii]|jgi:periplasmic divalent cation tolerance protein|uniref:divalent-cation tolerance protein CutA n=1 Tax=Roseicyclus amphidinii TaxID=3034232 RepID=UPI0024E0AEB3|nr:divalent-cation tolerance protein CutA [Roseicyclus sp. Amp-Y-6]
MIHVTTTCPDRDSAERLARAALAEHVTACANILEGVRSLYHWQGEIAEDTEVMVIFKTSDAARAALVAFLEAEHPYDVPVITWERLETTQDAADWLARETH